MQLQSIQNKIYQVRGERIMLNFDLAEMYEVETRALKQAVRRNIDSFHQDFLKKSGNSLSQIVITYQNKDQLQIDQTNRKQIGFKTNDKQ